MREAHGAGEFHVAGALSRTTIIQCRAEYGHREVLVKGYVQEVLIASAARLSRGTREAMNAKTLIFDPLHYLALLEQKTDALDQAAPLMGWELPECFAELRRLMEARLEKGQPREYVQVLRLLETFSVGQRSQQAIEAGSAAGNDLIRRGQSTCCCAGSSSGRRGWTWRTIRTCRWRRFRPRSASDYMVLLGEAGLMSGSGEYWHTADTPQVLLEHHLKMLRLPTFLREYDKVARQCADESVDFPRYLLRLRSWNCWTANGAPPSGASSKPSFPVVKSLDTFEFPGIPSLNKAMVLDLARCEFLQRRENVSVAG